MIKLKYKIENDVRVYYTEDMQFKIAPDSNGFQWYRMREGEYKCFGYSVTLYEAREYLHRLYRGAI